MNLIDHPWILGCFKCSGNNAEYYPHGTDSLMGKTGIKIPKVSEKGK